MGEGVIQPVAQEKPEETTQSEKSTKTTDVTKEEVNDDNSGDFCRVQLFSHFI